MKFLALCACLLAALGSYLPISAHAEDVPPEPAPFVEIHLLSTGEDAAALADGDAVVTAPAIVAVNQVLVGNRVVEDGIHSLTQIQDSFNDNTGIFGINQDAGNFSNQANVVAFVVGSGEPLARVLPVSIDVEKRDNVVISSNSTHEERIDTSFNGTTGITGVNQSAGSGNNQINAVAIGVGVMLGTDVTVLNDTDLQAVTSDEESSGGPEPVHPTIVDSFQGYRGIAQVSQANGNLNEVRNVLSVSVIALGGAQP
jgi:hypothetical protein